MHIAIRISLFLGLVGAILVGSVVNLGVGGQFVSGPIAHFMAFFVLCYVSWYLLSHEFVNIKVPYVYACLISLVLAVGVEVIQSFLPHRAFSYLDILWGALGAQLMCFFIWRSYP